MAASVLILCCLISSLSAAPNVLIFLVDDLGYGDLGYSGHPTISSPHLDGLAREGKVMTQMYAGSAVCTPSRASLLTGETLGTLPASDRLRRPAGCEEWDVPRRPHDRLLAGAAPAGAHPG